MELFPRNLLEVAPSSQFFNKKELGASRVYDSSGTYVPCKNPKCECKCVCSAHDSFNYAVSKYRKRSHHGLDSKKSLEVAPSSEFFTEQQKHSLVIRENQHRFETCGAECCSV